MFLENIKIEKKEKQMERKVAWGITGSGDKLRETVEIMRRIRQLYSDEVAIQVYLSKAAEIVMKYYRLEKELRESLDRVWVEVNANSPFLAGQLQLGRFEFLLIAPATSNTVAKISVGIADSLLSNSAIMALKALVPVYVMPCDYEEGETITRLPDGRDLKLRVRKEDAENVRKLAKMEDMHLLRKPEDIQAVFEKHFGAK
jgi:archaeoflavoprotein AfpA